MRFAQALTLLLLSLPSISFGTTVIMSESRRAEYLQKLEALLLMERPNMETLAELPDPFRFGREIEEEAPPPITPGMTDEEVLSYVGKTLQENIIGYQSFGSRASLATKDFGLLRDGNSLEIPLPDSSGKTATVTIRQPTAHHFTIQINDLIVQLPLKSGSSGIEQSRP